MCLVQDLLQSGGYVWSDYQDVGSCYESGKDGRGTHFGDLGRGAIGGRRCRWY